MIHGLHKFIREIEPVFGGTRFRALCLCGDLLPLAMTKPGATRLLRAHVQEQEDLYQEMVRKTRRKRAYVRTAS